MLKKVLVGVQFASCLCMNVQLDVFQETIDKYATSVELQAQLEMIRDKSKEADLFVNKYFGKDVSACNYYDKTVVDSVEHAAVYVAGRLYEEGLKSQTDTEALQRALMFAGNVGGIDFVDSRSEANMNSLASLRREIAHLLELRTRYNEYISSSEFKTFLQKFAELLKK